MGALAALGAAAVWATASIIFTHLGRQNISPLAMNLIKCSLALALMILTLGLTTDHWTPQGLETFQWVALGVSGVIGLTLGDTAYFHALGRLGPRRTLLLATLGPMITALLAWPLLNEPMTVQIVAGICLTLLGVAGVIFERSAPGPDVAASTGLTREEKVGIGFALLATTCQAVGNVLSKYGGQGIDPLEMSITRLIFGVAGVALVVTLGRRLGEVALPFRDRRQTAWLVLATILGTYLGIWLLMAGLRYTTHAGVAATLSATSPIFVLPLAAIFLSDRPSPRAIAGACVAVAGIAVLSWPTT